MPVVKFEHRIKMSGGLSIAMSVEAVIDTEEEARELGEQMIRVTNAYCEGFSGYAEEKPK